MIDVSGVNHRSRVTIDEQGVIVVTIRGPQNRETIRSLTAEVRVNAEELRVQGRKVSIFVDASEISLNEVSSSARQESKTILETFPFDQAVIYAKGIWAITADYMIRLTNTGERIKFFTNKNKAWAWLRKVKREKTTKPAAGLIVGILVTLIGLAAFAGWIFNSTPLVSWLAMLRPMNPLAALGLIGGGVGFISYWSGKLIWLRWTAGFGVVLGLAVLSPLPVDGIFFAERIKSMGTLAHLADSAAICFIAMGVAGLIARRKGRWVRPIEYTAIAVVGGLALINVFGHMYIRDRLYESAPQFVMAFNLAVAFLIAAIGLALLVLYRKTKTNVLTRFSRVNWMIITVLVLVQFATYGAWFQATQQAEAASYTAFKSNVKDIEVALNARVAAYTNALYGFQGLFLASSGVNQAEFATYYKTTNVATNYPGLRAISFISKVKDKDLAAFVQTQRQDKSLNPGGNPAFTITQRANANDHYILTYVANTATVGGTDFASNPSRLAAYEKAEATRRPVVSSTVEFAATATAEAQSGFFITVPITWEGSRDVSGFVSAVFNYKDFFSDTFSERVPQDRLLLTIADTQDNKELYRSDKTNNAKRVFQTEIPITIADRTWLLAASAPQRFVPGNERLPAVIFIAGQIFSLLLIIIFWIQFRARQQALNLADAITKDLQDERNRAVANDQKSKAILTSIGDGVFVVDTKGRITMLNPAAQAISGVSEDETIGKPYTEILRFEFEKTAKVNNGFVKKALAGHGADMGLETVLVRADGKRIPVADSAAPIRDASGKTTGAIVVFRDVSKEYELDKAKTEFVSLASHQLRTPLSAINWYGEMLLGGDTGRLSKEQYEYIKEIFEGSQRMVELVNSLLDVSRLEVGKLPSRPAPTKVQELVRNMERELAVTINAKDLKFTTDLANLAAVTADPKQLRMIVQNLMSNAVKYTDEKDAVHVVLREATAQEVEAARLRKGKPYWFLSVADSGYGIPASEHSKIFGKLYRADNVRKLDVEGTGLGLYIVKEIVDKMGGSVWFESTEGKGATFYVIAPMQVKTKT
jgi:PAS domain S-box-containing protein